MKHGECPMPTDIANLLQQALNWLPENTFNLNLNEIIGSPEMDSEPDNLFYNSPDNDTFTGTAGEIDYFIYDMAQDAGSDIINNFDPEQDKLFMILGDDGSYSISSSNFDQNTTYVVYQSAHANSADLSQGEIIVNATSESTIWPKITTGLIFV
jgi:hypothetical protein